MQAEVIAIGSELLLGIAVNSNAAFISSALSQRGWHSARHTTIPDDPVVMKKEMQEALARVSCVIVTGGLGPTCDDRTREVAAELFASPLEYNKTVAQDLISRYGENFHSLNNQATQPIKATVLLNPLGSAPGLIFQEAGKTLVLLPGVPFEMKELFTKQVLPYLEKLEKEKIYHEMVHLCLLRENDVDPLLQQWSAEFPDVSIGIYPSYGTVTVCFMGQNRQTVALFKQKLTEYFPTHIFSAPSGKIEEAVHELFSKKNKQLIFAESCTGGMLSQHVTAYPGASNYFLGSIVAYSNALKTKFLHVSKETLDKHGAVSKQVVEQMLQGVFEESTADYGIAVSGIAGPGGGSPEKPVGTIWAAIGERGEKPHLFTFKARGSRETIIFYTTNCLLAHLWRNIVYGVIPV